MNVVFGSAGFAKDVDWLIDEIYRSGGADFRPNYFIAENDSLHLGRTINHVAIISEEDFFQKVDKAAICNCFVAVGSPIIRYKIVMKIKEKLPLAQFPCLIHPDVSYDKRPGKVIFGEGSVITAKCMISSDVKVGKFVHVNLDSTIGHDTVIGDFCTISPGVHISGNVQLENRVFIGTGANILERLNICDDAVIGAGSTVVKKIEKSGTYVGVPAKLLIT